MKFEEKLLILIVAVVISVLGFNLIASSSVCLLTAAKEAGYESFECYRARCEADVYQAQQPHKKINYSRLVLPGKKNGC